MASDMAQYRTYLYKLIVVEEIVRLNAHQGRH